MKLLWFVHLVEMQFRSVHRPPSGRAIAGNRRLLRTYNLFAFTIRKRVVVKAFIVMAGYKKFETAMPKETALQLGTI